MLLFSNALKEIQEIVIQDGVHALHQRGLLDFQAVHQQVELVLVLLAGAGHLIIGFAL